MDPTGRHLGVPVVPYLAVAIAAYGLSYVSSFAAVILILALTFYLMRDVLREI